MRKFILLIVVLALSLAPAMERQNGADYRARRVARLPDQSTINHRSDSFDGDRTFGHVGGQDDFGLRRRRQGAVLFFRRLIAVQSEQRKPTAPGQRPAGPRASCSSRRLALK